MSSQTERRIERLECPTHGPDTGIVSTLQGVSYCQHCRIPAGVLIKVEYVPYDDDSDGAELDRMESDMMHIHDVLTEAGLEGSINADSIIERIEILVSREATDV